MGKRGVATDLLTAVFQSPEGGDATANNERVPLQHFLPVVLAATGRRFSFPHGR